MTKTIISASRRTDLPRFHYDWLQAVLQAGQVVIANPRYPLKTYAVDLRPEKVHSLVLWSKDFSNILEAAGLLENYNLYFQYTINGYSRLLEPLVPEQAQAVRILDGLLKRYSPAQFNIRFDPVVISTLGEMKPTADRPEEARLEVFDSLCRHLVALGMQDCRITTSYIAMYAHVRKRLAESGLHILPLDEQRQTRFFGRMAEIAAYHGLRLFCCASPSLGYVPGIQSGRCIDGYLLEGLFGGKVSKAKDSGQRVDCCCHKSYDIGDYDKRCLGGCLYCYAVRTTRQS